MEAREKGLEVSSRYDLEGPKVQLARTEGLADRGVSADMFDSYCIVLFRWPIR